MSVQKVPTAPFHPGYGCAILVIMTLTFGGIVSWVFYSGYEQDRQISAFTVSEAPPLETPKPTTQQADDLKARLADFSATLNGGQSAKLTLSLADLNTLITLCADAGIADYRGVVRFNGMDSTAQVLKADIRWKMNNLPFTERKERYLVGKADFKPDLDTKSLEVRIIKVDVPGKQVSEGFLHQLEQWPWLNLAKTRPEIAAVLSGVTTFQITPEQTLLLEAKPVTQPPRAKSPPK
jgi:hypothetical protein